ncbi:MAG: NAD-dependent epimerase/dehydratase family protein, partial [Thermoleophilaceae bacterium]|nr:NAD-dependent epimerase/dehydratase family protein [Thermoleophilaceae bacterium]
MRVVVTGASGNVGTSVIRALQSVGEVEEIVGLARRVPTQSFDKVRWTQADVTRSDLEPHFRGADAVIHLAWLIQPSRDPATLRRTNVEGSARVFHAAGAAGVPSLVHASSVGVYSPGPKDRRVDEGWPTEGIPTSAYSRHKAEVERLLDRFEAERPGVRVIRLRPGLIFKREAASEIRRYFAGPLLPNPLLRRGLIPVTPDTERLRFQAVHSHDVGEAYRLAVLNTDASGAFNVA